MKTKAHTLHVYEVWAQYTNGRYRAAYRSYLVVAYSEKGAKGFVRHADPDAYEIRAERIRIDGDMQVTRAFLSRALTAEEGSYHMYHDGE